MKRTLVILLLLLTALSLFGSGCKKSAPAEAPQKAEAATAQPTSGQEEENAALPPSLELGDGYGYDEFLVLAATAEAEGDACVEKGMELQAYTFYAAAACELGSLRLGTEQLIAAKTGALPEEVFEGSLYTSWEELAALFHASPYPDYFEGLSHMCLGEEDAATICWTNAAANAAYPAEGMAFTYLLDMDAEGLTELRDALRQRENALLQKYEPQLLDIGRGPENSFPEYLLGMTREKLAEKNYGEAMEYARAAILAEPFSGDCYAAAALCALTGSDSREMAYYINEGLLTDPGHEGLKTLLEAYGHGGDEDETDQ